MAPGDPIPVTAGHASDVYAVDVDMLETPRYGSVYVVAADQPAVIDTGTGANYELILDAMADLAIAPRDLAVIAPTHVHLDHAGGAGYLARECPNADVYVHERGARHLVDPDQLWAGTKEAVGPWLEYYAEPLSVPAERVVNIADGDEIDLGDRALSVHDAPGHAPHQAVFLDPASDCAFTADAAGLYAEGFAHPRPTTPPPNFDLGDALADVETLRALDPAGLCFGHCGDAPTDGLLDAYADALEAWVAEVEAARDAVGSDVDAIVAELEAWPDVRAVWGEARERETKQLNVAGVLAAVG